MSTTTMDEKKFQSEVESLPQTGVVNYVEEIKSEFKKVHWSSKEELKTYTQIVVGATFAFGLGVFSMDVVIQMVLHSLNAILKFIIG